MRFCAPTRTGAIHAADLLVIVLIIASISAAALMWCSLVMPGMQSIHLTASLRMQSFSGAQERRIQSFTLQQAGVSQSAYSDVRGRCAVVIQEPEERLNPRATIISSQTRYDVKR